MLAPHLAFSFGFTHDSDTEVLPHRHDCHELVYYLQGSGTTMIDRTVHSYSDNTFSIIEPLALHNEIHRHATEVVCMGFPLHERHAKPIRLENGLFADRSCLLLPIVKKMKQEMSTPRVHSDLKLRLLLNEFLIEFERIRSAPSSSDSFDYIESFILENFNQDLDLPSLAKLSGYSYDHFRHLFKTKLGESPMNYIIKKRVEHAKNLMLATDMTMSAIAQDCGFSNSSQFSETFRKATGVSPSEFKRNHIIR